MLEYERSFFSWYYGIVSASVFVGMTLIVYIQDNMGWMVGFGVPVVLMILSSLLFFVASPSYVKSKPKASWITGLARVVVCSIRNRRIKLSSQATDKVDYHTKGSVLLVPSEKLRFLNKACIIRNPQEDLAPDGKASDSWSLCTVDQVEDLKALIKVIPIWSAGMLKSVNVSQSSFLVLQASTMERHITSKFEVPAASFPSILVLVITTWVVLYDRIIIPLASKARGKIVCLNLKQRMGIGILLSTISMAALAIAESSRRETAIKEGFSDDPDAQLNISAMWLLPHFILSGLAEAFNAIAQNEFFYAELPKTMSSVASTLQGLGLSAASLVSSFIVSAVRDFTGGEAQENWVSSNINKGHYDYYYWLLTILSLVNFVYYLVCSQFYGGKKKKKKKKGLTDDSSRSYVIMRAWQIMGYLTKECGIDVAKRAHILFPLSSATNLTPILRSYVAENYVGMVLSWLTNLPEARPTPCIQSSYNCKSSQLMLLSPAFFSYHQLSLELVA
uniref:Uncharacterized protein n=2 Tax=Salix viminalis TaxID=40686 RepID=A0A6N2NF67_SALVM